MRLRRFAVSRETCDESEREARCPRPDKRAWNTYEAALQIVKQMRSDPRRYPDARWLNAYPCQTGGSDGSGCGAYHVGDRRRHPDDPVMARWGDGTT